MAPPNPQEIIEKSREMRSLGLEATVNENRSINDGDDNPVQGVQTNSISNQGRQPAPYAPPRIPETSNMAARMPRRRIPWASLRSNEQSARGRGKYPNTSASKETRASKSTDDTKTEPADKPHETSNNRNREESQPGSDFTSKSLQVRRSEGRAEIQPEFRGIDDEPSINDETSIDDEPGIPESQTTTAVGRAQQAAGGSGQGEGHNESEVTHSEGERDDAPRSVRSAETPDTVPTRHHRSSSNGRTASINSPSAPEVVAPSRMIESRARGGSEATAPRTPSTHTAAVQARTAVRAIVNDDASSQAGEDDVGGAARPAWDVPYVDKKDILNRRPKRRDFPEISAEVWARILEGVHEPAEVAKQQKMYADRVAMATQVWCESNVRGAVDDEEVEMGVKAKTAEMLRVHLEEDKLEERTAQEATPDEVIEKDPASQETTGRKAKDKGKGKAVATQEDLDVEAVAPENDTQEFPIRDDDAISEAGSSGSSHHPPDIPSSFEEDFQIRQAAETLTLMRYQPFASGVHVQNSQRLAGVAPIGPPGTASAAFADDPFSRQLLPSLRDPSMGMPPGEMAPSRLPQFSQPSTAPPLIETFNNGIPSSPRYELFPPRLLREQTARNMALSVMNQMEDIERRDIMQGRQPLQRPVRMHDFEYRNLVNSGRIGGPADHRMAGAPRQPVQQQGFGRGGTPHTGTSRQPARPVQQQGFGPSGGGGGTSEGVSELEASNNRIMSLMTDELGLTLEAPPPPGQPFPPMTGPWPEYPEYLFRPMNPYETIDGRVNNPFSEGPSSGGAGSSGGQGGHPQYR